MSDPRSLGVGWGRRPISVVVAVTLLLLGAALAAAPAEAAAITPSVTPGVGEAVAPAPGHSRLLFVPVDLSRRVGHVVRVHWATSYLTPQPTNTPEIQAPTTDYRTVQGTILIPPGQKRGWAPIRITGDTYGREYLLVALSAPDGAPLADAVPSFGPGLGAYAVGLIADRGVTTKPTVGFSGGAGVILDQPTDRTVTVDWSVISFGVLTNSFEVDGAPFTGTLTPAPASYYTPSSGSITLAPGQVFAFLPVTFLVNPPCVITQQGDYHAACYYVGFQLADPVHASLVAQPPPVNGVPVPGNQTIDILDNGNVFN
jgi:hypothetical protein